MGIIERIRQRMTPKQAPAGTKVPLVMWDDPRDPEAGRKISLMNPEIAALDAQTVILIESPEGW